MFHRWIEEFVHVLKSAAGKDDFRADVLATGAKEFPQLGLLRGVRSKVGMAPFGAHGQVLGAVPEENGFAKAGAGGDDHGGGIGKRHAFVNGDQVGWGENTDTESGGFQVVQNADTGKPKQTGSGGAIDNPGKIGAMHAVVDHRPGNTEGRGIDLSGMLLKKILDDFLKSSVLVAEIATVRNAHEFPLLRVEQPDVRFRAADVARENHRTLRIKMGSRKIVPEFFDLQGVDNTAPKSDASAGHRFG